MEDNKDLYRRLNDYLAGDDRVLDKELLDLLREIDKCGAQAALPDEEKMWERIREAIARSEVAAQGLKKQKAGRRFWRWGIAAMLAVPLAVAAWWGLHRETGKEPLVVAEAPRHEVMLRLANGETVQVRSLQDSVGLREGSARIWVDTSSFMAYRPMQEMQPDTLVYNVLSVPRSCEYRLRLADGTMVWLNSDSELRYPVNFAGRERRVFLKGEAYFDVARNMDMPFRVEAGEMEVEVLGTEFNMNVYGDDGCLRTTLAEGKVRVSYAATRQACILEPGEQALLEEGALSVRQVDLRDVVDWKEGRFVFSDLPLEAIVRQLERWYDVEFDFFDPAAKYYRFTGVIMRHKSLQEVLALLEETTDVKFKTNANEIEVFRKTTQRLK
ncbi:MAG TPA: DUF4974 domain-containing protein [Candidatus Odoribacter faecigallinarum]|uniref:DUF4974 domain-containing protein n=1 Tax=Candidatus Odoribacter faecigallinarum TaxID=2838706 RepID=A0A9D1UYC0_9BACT|nr:DUF4974 domain-containing protein [Candidatus Odoribacter faecigallinarum]